MRKRLLAVECGCTSAFVQNKKGKVKGKTQ